MMKFRSIARSAAAAGFAALFAVSEPYFRLREALGLAIKSAR